MNKSDFPREAGRIRPMLVAVASRITGDSEEAEDIVQDVLLKLWSVCPQLRMPVDALASVMTRNMALSAVRRRRPASDIAGVDICGEEEESPEEKSLERIMKCVESLPAVQQIVFRLRHTEGMDFAEIARLTGSTEAAVRKAVSRARQSIRNQYLKDEKNER